jgi:hypothetical protein
VRLVLIDNIKSFSYRAHDVITCLCSYQTLIEAQNLLGCTALMMEAARTSETSVDIQLRTRQYIPEDSELHTRRRENLKSHRF